MAKNEITKQVEALNPESGLASKTVTVFIDPKDENTLWLKVKLDTVVQNAGRSGISKRTGEKWEQIHPLLAKIGQQFGNGMAWFGDLGIALKVCRRGEAKAKAESQELPDWAK